jgi:hypothetical protein
MSSMPPTSTGAPSEKPRKGVSGKRLQFDLSASALSELSVLASERGCSITELFRLGIGLLSLVATAQKAGHKVIVTTAQGRSLKEIVLPGSPNRGL